MLNLGTPRGETRPHGSPLWVPSEGFPYTQREGRDYVPAPQIEPFRTVTLNMVVKHVDLYSTTRFKITLEKLNGPVQGTVTFDAPIASAHDYTPGDTLRVTFETP